MFNFYSATLGVPSGVIENFLLGSQFAPCILLPGTLC